MATSTGAPAPRAARAPRGSRPRRRVPRAQREGEILQAAWRAFAARGYHAVSMDEIAEEAGITKPMVYAYFGSKEGLFQACVDRAARRLMAAMEEAATLDASVEVKVWRGLLSVFDFIEANREAWALLYPSGPNVPGGPVASSAAKAFRDMVDLMGRLMTATAVGAGMGKAAAEHAEPMAHALVAATVAMGTRWLQHPEEPKELQALRLMNFAWMGFGDVFEGRLWQPPPEAFAPRERPA